ncbi:N-acetylglucosamine-6-phosphate deacetylase [Mammaliicoccus stepanovicii]|uniref:N-acetylglucosamine-6-phosphate deacetylase n=1 Tax=Mammaliicoccus stepanovicii TaxID=643214 RepID=A0A239YWS2_9STAP|nr:N-acetylglucosamine-6-phosphate deacetylase [Mammaliicoccus stepanovicii]PNZ75590.1 N-acetylglucosamine-6-phosphate deacetylase [Mammaliicoccus stepanovicii]GGI40645.1 N-acetylglucosamine-6-phosphate deacetylase [Mammaliicoccus stepanovicii]SNV62836.1 N-acetylglucosamine-6-phosphate deacetylase [Mammaliicoccus stepanovicii]
MNQYSLTNAVIYTEEETINSGFVEVKDGIISKIGKGIYEGDLEQIDLKGHHLIPGFIDIHIHGGYGQDAMDATPESLNILTKNLLSEGTTSFLATTMTQSTEAVNKALENIANFKPEDEQSAEILGVHLEGPFISEFKVGAQNPEFVARPSVQKFKDFQKHANNLIKIVTIAPEVDGAGETIKTLCHDVIFSAGHTVSDFDGIEEAVDNGLKHITHLYNAQTTFTHREPGVFGAALTDERLTTEVIVDGVHSHPNAVKLAYLAKGNKNFCVITDAMRAKGMQDGKYDLGGQDVIVKNNEARLESGSLAGSILLMNQGLKNLMNFAGISLEEAWRTTSLNQAIRLNVDDKIGSIKVGKKADLVVVDSEINVLTTIKNGYVINND